MGFYQERKRPKGGRKVNGVVVGAKASGPDVISIAEAVKRFGRKPFTGQVCGEFSNRNLPRCRQCNGSGAKGFNVVLRKFTGTCRECDGSGCRKG